MISRVSGVLDRVYHTGIHYVGRVIGPVSRGLELHSKIALASCLLGGAGYLAYRTWSKLAGHEDFGEKNLDSSKIQSFAFTAFFSLVCSNLLNPPTCALKPVEDRGSIQESVGTSISLFQSPKRHDHLVLRLARVAGRLAALAAISTVIAPFGVGWNGGRLINHFVFSRKEPKHATLTAFGQDVFIASLIPSYSLKASTMIQAGIMRPSEALATCFGGRTAKVCMYAGAVSAALIGEMVSKLQWAVFPAGLSLLYSSSIDLKKYIFALSPSLSAPELQELSKSLFVRWHFGLVGRGGNLLTSHCEKDREDFTTTKGHFNDLMCAAGWQLLTKLELIQERLPPSHKLTTLHLASRTSLVGHLNSVPMERAIPAQESALCRAQDASLLTQQDVAEVDRLWSTLEQIQALFKNIIEIGLNQSDLLLHTLGIRPRGCVWKTVIVPPFYQLKPEYAARFSAIPSMTAEEKKADWKKYLQSCILNELGASLDLSKHAEFVAIKERVQQSKTPWECLGLSEIGAIRQRVNEQYREAQLVVHPDKAGTMYPHTASQAAAALACALTRAKELCLPKGSRRAPSESEA